MNYQPNSDRYRQEKPNDKPSAERPKIDPIASGRTKKRSFFDSDDAREVGSYVKDDVIIPAIKRLIWEVFTTGLGAVLGEQHTSNMKRNGQKINYRGAYKDGRQDREQYAPRTRQYTFEDVIVDSRDDAEEILYTMGEIIAAYGVVRVADLYELVGITGQHTDNKYGWADLRSATYTREYSGGYKLKLPKVMPID